MRCPTCSKRIGKDEQVCSYCGGLVAVPASQEEPASGPPVLKEGESPWETVFGPRQVMESEVEEAEEPASAPPPEAGSPPPSPPARPQLPLLFRLLLPLIFLLIPLFNFLFWDSPANPWARPKPVLQQAVLCEGIRQDLPVNPKSVFSLRRDRQIAFYSRWSGSRAAHAFSLRWFTPEGNLHKTTALLRYRLGKEEFSSYAALPLEAGMSLGEWRVEVSSDQQFVARLRFQLQE